MKNKNNYEKQIKNIAEILELGIPKVSNKNLQMLCPFHNENNASFGIDITKGIYHCFSCGISGNINNLVETLRGSIIPNEIENILDYKIKTLIDGISYKEKPKDDFVNITNRIDITENFRDYTIRDIIALIVHGHTVVPAGIKKNEDWEQQQIVMLDFDNKDSNFSRIEVLKYAKEINLLPTFTYYTFSNTPEKEKFRFCYCFKTSITNKKQMECIINVLLYKFKKYNPDNQCRQLSSKFLGTNNNNIELTNIIYEANNRFTEKQLNEVEMHIKEFKNEYNSNSNKKINSISAKELLNTELEPLQEIVDNLLFAGFSIMAGAPKVRKKLGLFRFMPFYMSRELFFRI